MSRQEQRPPREGLRFLLRALVAVTVITLLTAGATATAGLLQIKEEIAAPAGAPPPIHSREVSDAKPGSPQTLLILGSDRRWIDLKRNNPGLARSNPARSDTILLVRLDPDQQATAVVSIPRDLKVSIPGHGIDKINAAYAFGGPDLTARTVKALFGGDFRINHIINVNFGGFREAVDALGCVYTDVDHRYYHSNAGLPVFQRYAEIDVRPGYQRLCGQRALDYVRFRHADSDLVRAARQQDFLRAAKDQVSTSGLLGKRGRLIDIFKRNTQTDTNLRSVRGVIKLAKLAIFSAGNPVAQIPFPVTDAGSPQTGDFLETTSAALAQVRQRFFHAAPKVSRRRAPAASATSRPGDARAARARLVDARRPGRALVATTAGRRHLGFPLYVPTRLTPQGSYVTGPSSPRFYTLRDRAGRPHRAYRLVVAESEIDGQYYGVQGMSWQSPPAMAHPTSAITVHGRHLLLFKDGSRLRFVGWKRKDAVYWVSNSLRLTLTNAEMIGIAGSLAHLTS